MDQLISLKQLWIAQSIYGSLFKRRCKPAIDKTASYLNVKYEWINRKSSFKKNVYSHLISSYKFKCLSNLTCVMLNIQYWHAHCSYRRDKLSWRWRTVDWTYLVALLVRHMKKCAGNILKFDRNREKKCHVMNNTMCWNNNSTITPRKIAAGENETY